MRPGYLYFVIFLWLVFTGGRFTAPFLKEIAGFDDALIGISIAIQSLLGSLLGSVAAVYADRLEHAYPNEGRILFLSGGILFATISFEMHCLLMSLADDNSNSTTTTFFITLHVFARIMFAIFSSIVFPIVDGVTLSYLQLKSEGNPSSYGQERLFGAVSWAIASLLIGPTIDMLGFKVFFWTAPLAAALCLTTFFKYMVFMITACNNSHTTKKHGHKQIQDGEETFSDDEIEMATNSTSEQLHQHEISCGNNPSSHTEENQSSESQYVGETKDNPETEIISEAETQNTNPTLILLKSMLVSYTSVGFLICTLLLKMGMSVVENLIFLFFEQGLGGSNAICGLTVLVTVVFEIPIFHYAPRLLEQYGLENLQQVACLAYVTRVVGYTFVPKTHVALILLFEPLHGVTYACAKTSTVEFAAKVSPKGYEASGQGILSLITGVGTIVGLSLGGWVEREFGPVTLYRSYAGIVTIGLIIFSISIVGDKKRTKQYRDLRKQRSELQSGQEVGIA